MADADADLAGFLLMTTEGQLLLSSLVVFAVIVMCWLLKRIVRRPLVSGEHRYADCTIAVPDRLLLGQPAHTQKSRMRLFRRASTFCTKADHDTGRVPMLVEKTPKHAASSFAERGQRYGRVMTHRLGIRRPETAVQIDLHMTERSMIIDRCISSRLCDQASDIGAVAMIAAHGIGGVRLERT